MDYNYLFIWSIIILLCLLIIILSTTGYNYVRPITLWGAQMFLSLNILLFGILDLARIGFQFVYELCRVSYVNISYMMGFDGMSMCLLALSTFLVIMCIICYWHGKYQLTVYFLTMSVSVWVFHHVFTVLDLILFYIAFEAILTPMFILLGVWGSRERKVYAAYHLFLYTVLGSFFMMVAFFDIYMHTGDTSILIQDVISGNKYHQDRGIYVYVCLLLAFAIKIPLVPFHIWLPEAHVEAPTPGSILLAGVLLKLGSYGLMRFVYNGPGIATSSSLTLYLFTIAALGFVYCSFVAWNQQDMKKILAYSSVAHMNMAIMGLFSQNIAGLEGFGILMLAHGFVASALFYLVGMVYERYKSRLVMYYSGLVLILPRWSWFLFILVLGNIAFPGTVNFVGELLITLGIAKGFGYLIFVIYIGMVLTLIYSFFLFARICFGIIKEPLIRYYSDMTRIETYLLRILVFIVIYSGFIPEVINKFFKILWSSLTL